MFVDKFHMFSWPTLNLLKVIILKRKLILLILSLFPLVLNIKKNIQTVKQSVTKYFLWKSFLNMQVEYLQIG